MYHDPLPPFDPNEKPPGPIANAIGGICFLFLVGFVVHSCGWV